MRSTIGRALVQFFCIAVVLATAGAARPVTPAVRAAHSLTILQIDVGQGDATLIVTPEGQHILIDAGRRSSEVPDWLVALEIDTLDLVIASHGHADHIGGMPDVLFGFVVRAYLDNGIPHTTATYQQTMAAVEQEPDLVYLEPTNRTITLGSTSLRILPPAGLDGSQNNNSVGVLVTFGAFRALFTGDSERPELEHWLATATIPRVQVLKAAHHGARNGVTDAWAQAVLPTLVIIPVGRNSYGHPAPEVEQLWSSLGALIARTDLYGSIEVTAAEDGTFDVITSK